MTTELAKKPAELIEGLEAVLLEGDLSSLNEQQRLTFYTRVCESVGLNPLTQPFEYLRLNNKLILYARRSCTEQLRKLHAVSVTIVSRETVGGVYVVTAQAKLPSGRCDESIGAVPVGKLQGEALANSFMRAETKAKRRVTLAICGMSFLDESELDGVADKITRIGPAAAASEQEVRSEEYGPDVIPGGRYIGLRFDSPDVPRQYMIAMVAKYRAEREQVGAAFSREKIDVLSRFELEIERRRSAEMDEAEQEQEPEPEFVVERNDVPAAEEVSDAVA